MCTILEICNLQALTLMNTTLNLWYVNVTLDYAKNVSGETTLLCSLTAECARHALL